MNYKRFPIVEVDDTIDMRGASAKQHYEVLQAVCNQGNRVCSGYGGYGAYSADTCVLILDSDTDLCWTCRDGKTSTHRWVDFIEEEQVEQPIKPEDEVTVTTTYAQLAKVYAVLGSACGYPVGQSLWGKIGDMLDSDQKVYRKLISGKQIHARINYSDYQEEWENALFPQKTGQQQKIEELEKTIQQAQQQIQELKNS